tara:strand:+ start:29 stop:460 length:432 start_codon:yes stop_codon:yes gene_type:complete
MKIYVNNFKIKDSLNIEKYLIKEEINYFLYTLSNIYKIYYNEIYLLDVIEKPIENYNLNNYELIIDNSYFIKKNSIYQIPVNYYLDKIFIKEYKLDNLSDLKLVIEYKDNNIYSFYFILNNKANFDYFNRNNILTFLSLISNI